jgi:N6-L-threonylcarbamoyladenine synthase
MTKILAIETSTDETAVAVVEAENAGNPAEPAEHVTILGNALLSQAALHNEYGGVYPNLAKREHAKNLVPICTQALKEAGMILPAHASDISHGTIGSIKNILEREPELFVQLAVFLAQTKKPDIDAIAVTVGPGLEPALWVGVNFARALALAWSDSQRMPVVPVNHMEGHIFAALYERHVDAAPITYALSPITYPAIALLVSGGHTELLLMKDLGKYELIGRTRDDAAGEAFDKTARLLGLPYPGGPEISALAQQARARKLPITYSLPRPMLDSGDLDFSFSGLKMAVRNMVKEIGEPDDTQKRQVAREIEDAIVDVLLAKTQRAVDKYGARALIVSGGVSANIELKRRFTEFTNAYRNLSAHFPTSDMATDNAIMIALAGAFRFEKGEIATHEQLAAKGNMSLY